jgi:hypothetical protein
MDGTVTFVLSEEAYRTLAEWAEEDRREPGEQAAWLLEDALEGVRELNARRRLAAEADGDDEGDDEEEDAEEALGRLLGAEQRHRHEQPMLLVIRDPDREPTPEDRVGATSGGVRGAIWAEAGSPVPVEGELFRLRDPESDDDDGNPGWTWLRVRERVITFGNGAPTIIDLTCVEEARP